MMKPVYERVSEVRAPRCSLISIVPFPIIEEKPGLIPNHFEIEASLDGKPQVTLVGECLHHVWIDEVRGSLKVSTPSYAVAASIVADYLSAQLGAGPVAHPGLTWLQGEWTTEKLLKERSDLVFELTTRQHQWFIELVKLADDDWQRTRQHTAITDVQRHAARSIDPENKAGRPWIFANVTQPEHTGPEMTACFACGSDIKAGIIICPHCRCILDKERYKALTLVDEKSIDISKVLRPQ